MVIDFRKTGKKPKPEERKNLISKLDYLIELRFEGGVDINNQNLKIPDKV